jgi:chemotaxis protein MotB
MAKKKCPECESGAPAWMVTYGDMMTLLLTFFVLIVSFSSTEVVKFKAAMESVREGLGIWSGNSSPVPNVYLRNLEEQRTQTDSVIEEVEEMQLQDSALELIEVYNTPQGVRLILSDSLLFNSGSSDLTPVFEGLLLRIGEMIQTRSFDLIRVEGHTDNIPINTPRFPSNWELSALRAVQVVKYLAEQASIAPEKLSGAGYGEFRPRATNESPPGRARNRRVEIFLEFADSQGSPAVVAEEQTP